MWGGGDASSKECRSSEVLPSSTEIGYQNPLPVLDPGGEHAVLRYQSDNLFKDVYVTKAAPA